MPYRTLDDLPGPIKANLPRHAQEIFMAAYNSAAKEHPGEDDTNAKIAWAAVKTKFHRDDSGEWVAKGGPGSGNYGHAGRPGELGGSMPTGGFAGGSMPEGAQMSIASGRTAAERQAAAAGHGEPKWGEGKVTIHARYVQGEWRNDHPEDRKFNREALGMVEGGGTAWNRAGNVDWGERQPTNAKITFREALQVAHNREWASHWQLEQRQGLSEEASRTRFNQTVGRKIVERAVGLVSADHSIRTRGRPLTAKFPGADTITGDKIQPGDSILYAGPGMLVRT